MAEVTLTPGSQRDQERKLDAAASPLDVHTDTDFRETLRLVVRAMSYIRYFWGRFTAKFLLMWLSLLSPLILPWPLKIVIDNVVLGTPTDPEAFPVLLRPLRALPRRHGTGRDDALGRRARVLCW